MNFDPEVANSGGFFKDPVTKQWLTGNEPRVVEGHIDEKGKYVVPQIKLSDGSTGKLVFRFWSKKEKELYDIYRKGAKAKKEMQQKEEPQQTQQQQTQQQEVQQQEAVTHSHDKYGPDAASKTVLDVIKKSNVSYGVWIFDTIKYDLLGVSGNKSYTPVPRSIIPIEDKLRLRIPVGGRYAE